MDDFSLRTTHCSQKLKCVCCKEASARQYGISIFVISIVPDLCCALTFPEITSSVVAFQYCILSTTQETVNIASLPLPMIPTELKYNGTVTEHTPIIPLFYYCIVIIILLYYCILIITLFYYCIQSFSYSVFVF